jgi:uncharacterized membrane protein YjjP (DUF1212 family)
VYIYPKSISMKKVLIITVGIVAGMSVMLLFGYPLSQALFTGVCATFGMYVGKYFSKRRAKKMNS